MVDDVVIKISGNNKEIVSALQEIKKEGEILSSALTKSSLAAGAAFVGLSAAIGLSVKEFAKFDNEIRGVRTLLDETSFAGKSVEVGFAQMREEALKLAASSPVAISSMNKALFDTVSAGIDAAKAVKAVGSASKLAVAGLTDVSVATDAITSALNAFSISADKADSVSAKFFTAQKFGKTTIEELSKFFGRAASTASAFGVSLDELLGSVAAATTGGIKTQAAFTGVNAVLANISKPAKEAKEEAKRLGIEFNSTALRSKGLTGFLNDLTKAQGFNKTSVEKLFGSIEAQKLIFSLTGAQAKKYKQVIKELGNEQKTLTTFTKAFNIQNASLENKMKSLESSFGVLAIKVGEEFAPAVGVATDIVSELISVLADGEAFSSVAAKVLIFGTTLTGIAASGSIAALSFIKIRGAIQSLNLVLTVGRVKAIAFWGGMTLGLSVLVTFLPEIIGYFKELMSISGDTGPIDTLEGMNSRLEQLKNQRNAITSAVEQGMAADDRSSEAAIENIDFEIETLQKLKDERNGLQVAWDKPLVLKTSGAEAVDINKLFSLPGEAEVPLVVKPETEEGEEVEGDSKVEKNAEELESIRQEQREHNAKMAEIELSNRELELGVEDEKNAEDLERKILVDELSNDQELTRLNQRIVNEKDNKLKLRLIQDREFLIDKKRDDLKLKRQRVTNAQRLKMDHQINTQLVNGSAQLASAIVANSGSSAKKQFAIQKALGIVQTLINAYMAKGLAEATIPPPAGEIIGASRLSQGLIASGLIAATTAVQLQGMQKGGVVPGIGMGDKVLLAAEPGEVVIPNVDVPAFKEEFSLKKEREETTSPPANIIFQGDIIADDDYVENKLIPKIRDAVLFSNADLGTSGA